MAVMDAPNVGDIMSKSTALALQRKQADVADSQVAVNSAVASKNEADAEVSRQQATNLQLQQPGLRASAAMYDRVGGDIIPYMQALAPFIGATGVGMMAVKALGGLKNAAKPLTSGGRLVGPGYQAPTLILTLGLLGEKGGQYVSLSQACRQGFEAEVYAFRLPRS